MPPAGPEQTDSVDVHVFTADRGDDGVRLDLVLLRWLRPRVSMSRRRLQAAIESGGVSVNGRPATKSAARLAAGDRLEARLPAAHKRQKPQAQPLPLEILYEDEHLLAVNKAPGIVAHPSYKHADGTLLNALLWHLRTIAGDDRPPCPERAPRVERACPERAPRGERACPRLLTRLDKDTSGVVLVSKTTTAHAALVRDQRAGAIRKEYLALVAGVPKPASGTICEPLARDRADVRRVVESPAGKASTTRYETVASDRVARLSLLRCELVTGRMHQIRVHLAARGWPIVGDRVYGPPTGGTPVPQAVTAVPRVTARQALHAWRVTLPHPVTREPLAIVAPLPADMDAVTGKWPKAQGPKPKA